MRRSPVPAEAMTTSPPPATEPMAPAIGPPLAGAHRVWRRCGVRRTARETLAAELAGEIEAAAADGYPPESVLGADVGVTARIWALERGLAGRSLQAATMLWVVVAGVVLGSSTAIVDTVVLFYGDAFTLSENLTPGPVLLTILVASAVMAVLLPVLGTWALLHHRGDPRASATARWLAVALPLGGLVGLVLVVVLGVAMDDGTAALPFMGALFLGSCAGAGLLARHLAVRYVPTPR